MINNIYNNKKTRVSAAVIAAFYIVIHGKPFNLLKALYSLGFYIALAISIVVAMFLVQVVHRCTVLLDQKYDWRTMLFTRIVMQSVFGIVLPCLIDLIIMSLFFQLQGQNAWENGFIHIDFPVIILLMVILNLYYLIYYLLYTRSNEEPIQLAAKKQILKAGPSTLIVHYNGKHIQFNVNDDIIFFFRSGRYVKALTVHGNEYVIPQTIGELEDSYAHVDFCRINRAVLINCTTVRGYATGDKRGSFRIIFKPPIAEIVDSYGNANFSITKDFFSVFRDRFEKL
ncbi:LytTR family DNA-binding domain-containing protein [Chryseobacterium sp. c4a]|uniref:LytTR family DNA-binding domain-containing protein n=1 Tax=Chryseobacterium sp. c4a TaxID=1573582 RepID=UPI0013572818|nr:LytTR family DNA-binding domain-containing protein [Chryseobacterium sp. c4a]